MLVHTYCEEGKAHFNVFRYWRICLWLLVNILGPWRRIVLVHCRFTDHSVIKLDPKQPAEMAGGEIAFLQQYGPWKLEICQFTPKLVSLDLNLSV